MENKHDTTKEQGGDNDILFSRTVKAGKRVYYIDVKCDRKGEYYLALTESKRIKDQGDVQHPVFEKHKLFLYREDLDRFQRAFEEAANFARENAPDTEYSSDWGGPVETYTDDSQDEFGDDFKLHIDF